MAKEGISKKIPQEEISKEVVYQEMYAEMRRSRDYELTSSTWYTTIFLALILAILNLKFGNNPSITTLMQNSSFKIVTSIVFYILAFGSIYPVWYSSNSFKVMREWTNDHEPSWKISSFTPFSKKITPAIVIMVTQFVLLIAAISVILI
jgi:hypothetical protein